MSQPRTETAEDKPQPSRPSIRNRALIVLGGLAIGTVVIISAIGAFGNARFSEFVFSNGSSLIVIISTTLFITALAALAALYYGLDLTDPKESLGLPPGSVRALIALFLLLAFVVMSLYVFQVTGQGVAGSIVENVTLEEYTALRRVEANIEILSRTSGTPATAAVPAVGGEPEEPATPGTPATYSVRVYRPLSESATQLALQIFTVLGTLVGTISGFYFGTRSLETAGNIFNPGGGGSGLSVSSLSPKTARQGTNPFRATIIGHRLASITQVTLIADGTGAVINGAAIAEQDQTSLKCDFNLTGAPLGTYSLLVKDAQAATVLDNALRITT